MRGVGQVELRMDHNQLLELPASLSGLTRLHTLTLADNRVPTIPPEFGLISTITTLAIHGPVPPARVPTSLHPRVTGPEDIFPSPVTGWQTTRW